MLRRSITNNLAAAFLLTVVLFPFAAAGQDDPLVVLTPEHSEITDTFVAELSHELADTFRVIDRSMAEAAFRSLEIAEPFNQTIETARTLAETVGCEYFVLIRAGVQRRAGVGRPDYFESHAAVFVVSGRTGRLLAFRLYAREGTSAGAAETALKNSVNEVANEITEAAKEEDPTPPPEFAEPPDPAPQTFRAPVPYKRMKPDYTEAAMIYGIEATVDVAVDIDASGNVLGTHIERWAGYGLDESVEQNIRRMNWRPAELAGKYLPMRILLRYNFKDIQNPK